MISALMQHTALIYSGTGAGKVIDAPAQDLVRMAMFAALVPMTIHSVEHIPH